MNMPAYQTASVHCHSTYCDGAHTLAEMTAAAHAQGLATIGFSGHCYTPQDTSYCMSEAATAQYRAEIAALRTQYRGKLEVLCGIEWDAIAPTSTPQGAWDYWIGSVHYVQGENGTHYTIDWKPELLAQCIAEGFGGDGIAAAEAYFAAVARVARQRPTILGHFDLIKKLNGDGSFFSEDAPRYKAAALAALHAAKEGGCVLELNTGGMCRGYRAEPYPSAFLCKEWRALGGEVTITADAHSAEHLTFGYDAAAAVARAAGFTQVLVLREGGFAAAPL